jgi:hypothetical protein
VKAQTVQFRFKTKNISKLHEEIRKVQNRGPFRNFLVFKIRFQPLFAEQTQSANWLNLKWEK